MLETFQLPFVQRGLIEVLFLAVGAGLVGTWIVLRGLSFYSHALSTGAFPGLVLADGLAFPAHLGAAGAAAAMAGALALLTRRGREQTDSLTALVLVGALVTGVVLASDVFHSGANVETLLFGSLLLIDSGDIAWAAGAALAVLAGTALLGHRWTATGFDAATGPDRGQRRTVADAVLLALIALVAVAALSAVGALLAAAVLVVPAATTRLVCARIRTWQAATVALAALEGAAGLWLSVELNAPPGATVAVLASAVFALVALGRAVPRAGLAVAAVLAALTVAGCGGGSGGTGDVKVVATTTQIGDVVRAVGGDDADVTQILKPNTDPHEYEPRPDDVRDTAEARVVFESGDDLDRWMGKVVDQAGGDPQVVDVGGAATLRLPGEPTGEEASKVDPHWWHDPRNVEAAVPVIRDALTRANPGARVAYAANARRYLARLRTLNAGIARCIARVPAARRTLVTDHDAFGYFARRYGIRVVGAVIPSQTTSAQPSAGDVAELARVIERERVRAVFPESSVNPRLARSLARQTGASADHTLYGDTLGPKGSAGGTYLRMEEANADAMVRGFTGGAQRCRIAGP